MRANELDLTIMNFLPQGIAQWPILEANDLLKQQHRPKRQNDLELSRNAPDVIAHYDSHFIRNYPLKSHENDPAHMLWAKADKFYIVDILADFEILSLQYQKREISVAKTKSIMSKLWSRFFKKPLKKALRKDQFTTGKELLQRPDLFYQLEDNWQRYVTRLSKLDNCVSVLKLKRDDAIKGGFAIVDDDVS